MALTKIGTDGVKDDAVTSDKVADSINSAIAANTAKTQTTINNNADNRVITGSGTANTLNAESGVVIDSSGNVGIATSSPNSNFKLDVNGAARIGNTTDGIIIENSTSNAAVSNACRIHRNGATGELNITSGTTTARNMIFNTKTSGTESMRIDTSGNVCVNTSSTGGAKLEVSDSAFYQAYFRGTGNVGGLRLGNSTNANAFIFYDNGKNMNFQLGTGTGGAGAEMMRIQSSGGISFNGDTAAANALDDYEEGTWTPLIRNPSGTGTAGSNNAGFYTKVGNVVHAHATVHWTALSGGTTAGAAMIVGLPFLSKNASNYRSTTLIGGQIVGVHNGNDDGMNIAIGFDANQSFVYLTGVNGSATSSYNYTHTPTVLTTGHIFGFSITYLT